MSTVATSSIDQSVI
jgi:hypothetical protein